MLDDDEFRRRLAAQTAAADQMKSSMGEVAALLAEFRGLLVDRGFTTDGAEDLAREWFVTMLDGATPADDE